MKKLKTSHVESLYDWYPLYKALYGRGPEIKQFEVSKLVYALNDLFTEVGSTWKLNLLEAFAGQSEHEVFVRARLPIKQYYLLDIKEQDNPNVITGDVAEFKLPDDVNGVVAYFNSLTQLRDNAGVHSRQKLVDMFGNILPQLQAVKSKHPRFFYFHLGERFDGDGFVSENADYSTSMNMPLTPDHPEMFELAGAKPYKDLVELSFDAVCHYDRFDCTMYQHVENCVLSKNGKPVHRFTTGEKYFSFRRWHEQEVVDIVKQACPGLTANNFRFFHSSITGYEFDFAQHDHQVPVVEGTDYSNSHTTDMMIIVP